MKFYWFLNSNSQKLILARFLIRPILDPKFPLMPSVVDFMESLTQEQDKLVMMGNIKPSKDQALVVGDSKVDSKGKKKSKKPPN